MKRTYTIQFVYNGVPHTYIDRTYDDYKPSMDLSDVALTLVEAVIKADNLYVEGELAHEIRLLEKTKNFCGLRKIKGFSRTDSYHELLSDGGILKGEK